MKKLKFILSAIAALSLLGLAGCDMTIDDPVAVDAPDATQITVSLAGENTLNVSSVTLNGVEVSGLAQDGFKPSSWDAIAEYLSVTGVKDGDTVVFTFTQPSQGTGAWNTWSVAFTDNSGVYGNLLRADTWVNPLSTMWEKGMWSNGGAAANSVYYNGFTYSTCGATLSTTAVVKVQVQFTDYNVIVTEYVDGVEAQVSNSADWS